jgi:hypothetical protein
MFALFADVIPRINFVNNSGTIGHMLGSRYLALYQCSQTAIHNALNSQYPTPFHLKYDGMTETSHLNNAYFRS